MCYSVVSKRYLTCRDGTNTGRAHNLMLQKLRVGPLETGQPVGVHYTPKGCVRFLPLSAGPVGLSFLTDRYDDPLSLPGTDGPVCRQAGRLDDHLARGLLLRSLYVMPDTLVCLAGRWQPEADGHPCAGNGWPMLCCSYPLHC